MKNDIENEMEDELLSEYDFAQMPELELKVIITIYNYCNLEF